MTVNALAITAPVEQVEQYVALLTKSNRLIALSEIPEVRQAIEAALMPATREQLGKALAVLTASFKWPSAEVIEDQQAFLVAMGEALKSYPYRVLIDTNREAVRRFKWIPAISEMCELADNRMRPLRKALLRLDSMPSRHQQIREAEAAAEQKADEVAKEYGEIEREFTAQFGPLPPDDIRSAWFAMSVLPLPKRDRDDWARAIRAGDLWAREATKFMAIVGYLVMAVREKVDPIRRAGAAYRGRFGGGTNPSSAIGCEPSGRPRVVPGRNGA